MKKYVPIEKMSKKAQKALHQSRRTTWGELNPVTRRPENPAAYQRSKSRRQEGKYILDDGIFLDYSTFSPSIGLLRAAI